MLTCAIGTTGLVCKWMLFLSSGGVLALAAHGLSTVKIQQNYCFFSKENWEPSILNDTGKTTEYLPCDFSFL